MLTRVHKCIHVQMPISFDSSDFQMNICRQDPELGHDAGHAAVLSTLPSDQSVQAAQHAEGAAAALPLRVL